MQVTLFGLLSTFLTMKHESRSQHCVAARLSGFRVLQR